MLRERLIAKTQPEANEENIIFFLNYRVTVLFDRLFRLEQNDGKRFRDCATQSVFFRNMDKVAFTAREKDGALEIKTRACTLILREKREDCRIVLRGKEKPIDNSENLLGTYRTLDCCDGDKLLYNPFKDEIKGEKLKLDTGVVSRSGVACFNDAASLSLSKNGEVLPECGAGTDEYIFAYGDDYQGAVNALLAITGKIPMVPRYALGNWWSRYKDYSDRSYLTVIDKFKEHDVPLTVATLDMDWHYSDDKEIDELFEVSAQNLRGKEYCGKSLGWTGYTWNKRLFPDYRAFLKGLKERNLHVTLNLHPADGVRFWEEQYADMAKAMGVDPDTKQRIPFRIDDTEFVNAYFEVLHEPFEDEGVDFWWLDWQQGTTSDMVGLDPLWALNHYHYLDSGRDNRHPLILSRYSGIGSHRYPLGFSGDTMITWNTLKYLPYFTATASNVGYTWWSHDIGGHMNGENDAELYTRMVQFGVFSPVNRLHGVNFKTVTKEPWYYDNGAGEIAQNFLRFRHRMIPYLYSLNYRQSEEGVPLIRPLYYLYPQNDNAYRYGEEYFFGDLLVVSVSQKMDKSGFAKIKCWLPEGNWTDIFTGERYEISAGGEERIVYRRLNSIPVFAKDGAVLALSEDKGNSADNPHAIKLNIYNGNGAFTLYEDSGEKSAKLKITTSEKEGVQTVRLFAEGEGVVPADRTYTLSFCSIPCERAAGVMLNGKPFDYKQNYTDEFSFTVAIEAGKEYAFEAAFSPRSRVERIVDNAAEALLRAEERNKIKQTLFAELKNAKSEEEFVRLVKKAKVSATTKNKLLEIL